MIRAAMSAHLADSDLNRVSFILNKRSVGLYSQHEGQSFVVPVMQKTHMIVALSDSLERLSRIEFSALERKWESILRQAQGQKLEDVLANISQHQPMADMLMLATEDHILIWQDRRQGIYLLRDRKLFRLQPTGRNSRQPTAGILPDLDLYAFKPRKGDRVLCLEADFVEAFDPHQLESVLNEDNQVMVSLQTLVKHLQTYRAGYDLSWIAFEVKQIESNTVFLSNQDDSSYYDSRKARASRQLLDQIKNSKASHIVYGQSLIIPEGGDVLDDYISPQISDLPHKIKPKPARPGLRSPGQRRQIERERILKDQDRRKKAKTRAYDLYPYNPTRKDKIVTNLHSFSFDPIIRKIRRLPVRAFNLFPGNRRKSLLAGASFILLFLVLIGLLLMRMRHVPDMRINEDEEVIETTIEEVKIDLKAIPPEATNLEVLRVLKSNNLQIRQKPDKTSALIATAQRGDRLIQLAEANDGWVYVRMADSGTEGYVFADYLLTDRVE